MGFQIPKVPGNIGSLGRETPRFRLVLESASTVLEYSHLLYMWVDISPPDIGQWNWDEFRLGDRQVAGNEGIDKPGGEMK